AEAAIVLEPTAREIVTVEGGLEWVRVVVRGRTGHSAIRYRSVHAGGQGEAVSAIEKAVKLLAAVADLERHWAVHKVHPLMPRGITTINPGVIAGGSGGGADGLPNGMVAYSNFADYCALGLSLKYLPSERGDDVRAEFEQYIARVAAADPWLREHPPEIEWGVSGVSFPPSEVASDHPLVTGLTDAFRAVAGEPRLGGFEAVSDLAWLAEAGIPAVLYGPGDIAQAHSSAEYVGVDELVEVASVVALALCDWCGVA
ncbi:MAG: formylaminopyrimidine deformylase, partial [Gaiellales bacterium]|nr:formylaminopyrimidine deformylase [Gaiellales bacterium]